MSTSFILVEMCLRASLKIAFLRYNFIARDLIILIAKKAEPLRPATMMAVIIGANSRNTDSARDPQQKRWRHNFVIANPFDKPARCQLKMKVIL